MLSSHARVLSEFPVMDLAVVGAIACAAAALVAGGVWLWKHHGELLMRRPVNEWTFTHMKALLPTTTVPRPAQAVPLPRRAGPLPMTYECDGARYTLDDLHRRTNTTAFVVLHRGELIHESYPGRFARAGTPLQLFSVTKSVTSMLIGIAEHEGAIKDITEPVVTYRPELLGTAYDGPTIEHLLDMSSGAGDLEDWTDPNATINRFEKAITTGGSLLDVVRGVERSADPGVRFNYSTIDSQVLGWVLEAATGRSLAEYAADRLWRHLGAEHDAFYWLTRGRPRTAIGGGSLNATARDMARIGLLMSRGGVLLGERLIPEEWVERSRGRGLAHLEVGILGPSGYPHYGYSNHWWTLGGTRRAYTALGVHGQFLFVDPDADVVVFKAGAWSSQDDEQRDRETIVALQALVTHLEGRNEVASPRRDAQLARLGS